MRVEVTQTSKKQKMKKTKPRAVSLFAAAGSSTEQRSALFSRTTQQQQAPAPRSGKPCCFALPGCHPTGSGAQQQPAAG